MSHIGGVGGKRMKRTKQWDEEARVLVLIVGFLLVL